MRVPHGADGVGLRRSYNTSNFLEDGLANVASSMRYLFDRLRSLANCVILFDEDRGILPRSRDARFGQGVEAANDVHAHAAQRPPAGEEIGSLATTRLRAFDSAIIRPGRLVPGTRHAHRDDPVRTVHQDRRTRLLPRARRATVRMEELKRSNGSAPGMTMTKYVF